MDITTQAFSVRLPADLHKAARLKSVRIKKTLNEIITEKIAEWVSQPDASETPKPRAAPAPSPPKTN